MIKSKLRLFALAVALCAVTTVVAANATKNDRDFGSLAMEASHFSQPLRPAPIDKSWIIEGNPVATNAMVATSSDRATYSIIWECTEGKFSYYYDFDETLMIIEGSVVIDTDHTGPKRYGPGDIITFKKGSKAVWTIEQKIRKIAFCRKPDNYLVSLLSRVMAKLERTFSTEASILGAPST